MVAAMTATAPQPETSPLDRPVASLYGVGPERAAQLARLELFTLGDLLLHRPRRYEDRRHFRPIAELQLDEPASTRGKIIALGVKWFAQHQKSIFEIIVEDGTGRLHCQWWNQPYMEKYFARGQEVVVFGKLRSLKPRAIDHPETEVVEGGEESSIHLNRLTPVYPLTEGLPQRWLRGLIWRTLAAAEPRIVEPWPGLARHAARHAHYGLTPETSLPSRARALHLLHIPETEADTELARQRLALDEFLELQCQIQLRRRNFQAKARALPCAGDNHLIKPFLARLGFRLTGAQTRVLRELRRDMSGPHPMRRLLQGEVGSGKTMVAACCALMALESGYSAALMAPTEILAEQHFARPAAARRGPMRARDQESTAHRPWPGVGGQASADRREARGRRRRGPGGAPASPSAHTRCSRPASSCPTSGWSSSMNNTGSAWRSGNNWCAKAIIRICW
jgi:ATP-dependent DNA helicase RecG